MLKRKEIDYDAVEEVLDKMTEEEIEKLFGSDDLEGVEL